MRLIPALSRSTLMIVLALGAAAEASAQAKPNLPGQNIPPAVRATKPTQPGGENVPVSIYGTVKDLDGKPTRGVLIQFSNGDNGTKIGVDTTDDAGNYSKVVGVPGNQRGYIVAPSFGPYPFEPSKAAVTSSKRVDFTIQRSAQSKTK